MREGEGGANFVSKSGIQWSKNRFLLLSQFPIADCSVGHRESEVGFGKPRLQDSRLAKFLYRGVVTCQIVIFKANTAVQVNWRRKILVLIWIRLKRLSSRDVHGLLESLQGV